MPDFSAFDFFRLHSSVSLIPPEFYLFQQDQAINEVILIETGLVKLTRSEHNGNEIIVGLLSSGRLVGAPSAISNRRAVFNAITVTSCKAYRLSINLFFDLMHSDSTFSGFVTGTIIELQHEVIIRLSQIGLLDARSHLANTLLEFSRNATLQNNGEVRVQLPLSDVDLAKMLAIAPEHLSRLFRQLVTDGLIRRKGGWTYITDIDLLKQEAEGRLHRRVNKTSPHS